MERIQGEHMRMFSGIAKLAREGPSLEQKARVEYRQLPARSLLNRCSGERMPFEWTINPYRGCEFGCKYCYARYTHEFMEYRDAGDFEQCVFAKSFDPAEFAHELRLVKRDEWIAIGTATDPYQPAERRYGVTRGILEVFARKTGFRLSVTTKSDLVARDAALLAEIAQGNAVRVNMTVTSMDAELARIIEPKAPRPDLRMQALRAIGAAGIEKSVFASPVMPGINDSRASLARVAEAAVQAGAKHFWAQPLFLKDCAAVVFLPFLEEQFPGLARAYRETYAKSAYLHGTYPERLRKVVAEIREEYGLNCARPAPAQQWGQLDLFELR